MVQAITITQLGRENGPNDSLSEISSGAALRNSESKYIVIYSTTRDILAAPFSFRERIDGTKRETRRAATYLGEGFLLFYSALKALSSLEGASGLGDTASSIPFADEILALSIVAAALVTGLITHPFIRYLTGSKAPLLGTLTCFLYWSGFCLFVIPPIFAVLLTGMNWLAGGGALSENFQFFTVMLLGVPFMFVYYLGTICNWIAHVHQTEPILAGIALVVAYLIPSAIISLIVVAAQSLFGFALT